jgi:hypothetical protein
VAPVVYKPVGFAVGMLAGLIASKLFKTLWDRLFEDDPAEPLDRDAAWGKVLLTAVLQGAILTGVRAVVNRAGAKGFERATGRWPADERSEDDED